MKKKTGFWMGLFLLPLCAVPLTVLIGIGYAILLPEDRGDFGKGFLISAGFAVFFTAVIGGAWGWTAVRKWQLPSHTVVLSAVSFLLLGSLYLSSVAGLGALLFSRLRVC